MFFASPHRRRRTLYAIFAAVTIGAGLIVHNGRFPMDGSIRDKSGDALWAMMMFWFVSTAVPFARTMPRAFVAMSVCVAVEFSQLIHAPALDALRHTAAGQLVLGSGFDTRDLAAYAVGVATALLLDTWLRSADRTAASGQGRGEAH